MTPDWDEAAALRYVRAANQNGCGLFGPSFRRERYRDPVCEALVSKGILTRVTEGRADRQGYWLTEELSRREQEGKKGK